MRPTIFNDRVANALRKWHHTARKHLKQSKQAAASSPGTPRHSVSSVHLLRNYRNEIDSGHTSPRMSNVDNDGYRDNENSSGQDEGRSVHEPTSIRNPIPRYSFQIQQEIDIQPTDFSFDQAEKNVRNS